MLRLLLVSAFVICLLCVSSSQAQPGNFNDSTNTATKIKTNTMAKSDISKPLRIAVAANFTPVLKVLLKDFSKQTGIKSQLISGASGAMFLQIKHGAPFDIFLSADSRRPEQLEKAGYAVKNSRKTYAIGQLALYSSVKIPDVSPNVKPLEHLSLKEKSPIEEQLVLEQLKKPPARFAIANPDIAPYGKAAKEVLTHLGFWQRYQSRLITGININQTFAQLRSKAVTRGIVANSQLVLNNLPGVIIPSSYHQPIEQQLIIIRASKQQVNARKLSEFLLSAQSQTTIVSYGYALNKQVNNTDEKLNELTIR
ncbi:molybdate ABC transporter substrate-binding protein [Colwellia sp. 75C3]|uniref:molybdate ABC transporter substrate-binding protein n=1 Tax=Colwellia sp. 75C3 TaxID=888425 RepID=UPI000C33FDE7|nr:molybdate ABC transporter substrate-binding protein [Colwellia sp. 75C3]PKG85196.1 molybdate ABC transporter substrate-binding protein [Colwellia sp. 75C3]